MVHLVFHISILRKYLGDPNSIVLLKDVSIKGDLNYKKIPIEILYWQVKNLRKKEVPSIKVLWRNHQVENITWEIEADLIK